MDTVPGTFPFNLSGHVVLITGANHGIDVATALLLAGCGARVMITYLRLDDEPDPGIPERYRRNRASNADQVLTDVHASGGEALAVEQISQTLQRPGAYLTSPKRS